MQNSKSIIVHKLRYVIVVFVNVYIVDISKLTTFYSMYCVRTLPRYSRINYMDHCITKRCNKCIQWTRVQYSVIIT